MWYKFDEKGSFVLTDTGDYTIEYCTEYHDEEGNRLFVPDTLLQDFKENFEHEDFE